MNKIQSLVSFLEGKKTFIISAMIVIFNALYGAGYIHITQQTIDLTNTILGGLGLGALRLGINAAVATTSKTTTPIV